MTRADLMRRVITYYDSTLAAHGTTPRGVDWSSLESQQRRFRQLLRLLDVPSNSSLLDYGCGYGALADFLHTEGVVVDYTGFDLSEAMVASAKSAHSSCGRCRFTTDRGELAKADYAVASGIFNVKLQTPAEEWRDYVLETVTELCRLARHAVAFNVLSSYSDPARQRPDLYYADPAWLFDHCKRHLTPSVALLHDYPLFEFTMVLRPSDG